MADRTNGTYHRRSASCEGGCRAERRQAHPSAQTMRLTQGKMAENSRCKEEALSHLDDKAQRGILQMRNSLEVSLSTISVPPSALDSFYK